jgi:hypothetical protein
MGAQRQGKRILRTWERKILRKMCGAKEGRKLMENWEKSGTEEYVDNRT